MTTTCNQSFMDVPSSTFMDASLAALFIEPRLSLPPDDDEDPQELKNLLFRATMDMESSRVQYECELHHLKHLLRTTMQERDEAREEALKLKKCFLSSGYQLSDHDIALLCPSDGEAFNSEILPDHSNLLVQNSSSKSSSSPRHHQDNQQCNMQLDSLISGSIVLNMDESKAHISDLNWDLQDLPELEPIPNGFSLIGEALLSEPETTMDSHCPIPRWSSSISDNTMIQQQQFTHTSQGDSQLSSDELHSAKPNMALSELFLNGYMRESSTTFSRVDNFDLKSVETICLEERPTEHIAKKHLPEPPESDLEVMLRSLPERGKLLQAVMKAGPLLETLLLTGPYRQTPSMQPPSTSQEAMENNPPPMVPCSTIPQAPMPSSTMPMARIPMTDIVNDMSRFTNKMNVKSNHGSSHPSSMLLCNKQMNNQNNQGSQALLNTSANLTYSNRLLRSSALLPKRLVFNRSDMRLHH